MVSGALFGHSNNDLVSAVKMLMFFRSQLLGPQIAWRHVNNFPNFVEKNIERQQQTREIEVKNDELCKTFKIDGQKCDTKSNVYVGGRRK